MQKHPLDDFPIKTSIYRWLSHLNAHWVPGFPKIRYIAAGPWPPWQAAQAAYPGASRTESRDGAPEILTDFFCTAHILVAKSYEMPHKISIFHGVDVFSKI